MTADKKHSRPRLDKEFKKLWALSGNRCAFPGCTEPLVRDADSADEPPAVVGEMAHIIPHSKGGVREDGSLEEDSRDSYENQLLLCPTHHKIVDKEEFCHQYNANVLRQMKLEHEKKYRQSTQTSSTSERSDDLYCSIFPISKLPLYVYSAATEFRKPISQDLWGKIDNPRDSYHINSFELADKKIFTFHNLFYAGNPFSRITAGSICKEPSKDFMADPTAVQNNLKMPVLDGLSR